MKLPGSRVVCQRGLNLIVEVTQANALAVGLNPHLPSPLIAMPTHPLVATGRVRIGPAVVLVLGNIDEAQVGAAIIELIAVDVVYMLARLGIEEQAVHVQICHVPIGSHSGSGIAGGGVVPFPLYKPRVVSIIDQRRPAARKGY